jgi:hypothetical protein
MNVVFFQSSSYVPDPVKSETLRACRIKLNPDPNLILNLNLNSWAQIRNEMKKKAELNPEYIDFFLP